MLDFYLGLDLLVVGALSVLALTVLLQNSKARLNRTFSLFVLCICVWIISNYVSNNISWSPQTATFANYFVFAFSYAASIYLVQFIINLASDDRSQRIFKRIYWLLFLIALSGATPLVVTGVSLQNTVYAVHFGVLAPLYFLSLVGLIVSSIYISYRNIKRTSGDQHARLKILFRSMCWTFPLLLLAQAVIPTMTGWFGLTNIGILPMVILVYGLYYGVVKHRLFDLRFFVFRAAAYLLTTVMLGLLYVGPVLYLLDTYVLKISFHWTKFILEVLLITLAATNYAKIKTLFDRLTSKIFFRDSYDSAALLGRLNRRLVSTTNLQRMLEDSAELISTSMKADFCGFAVFEADSSSTRLFGAKGTKLTPALLKKVETAMGENKEKVIVTDYIDKSDNPFKASLVSSGTALLVRLSNADTGTNLGYIILGYKKSGNPYNRQDISTLESISDVLYIAIQNALHYEEIQRFNITLQRKVDEATRQLRRTNAKLQALDETKDDFISMASHQMRTPLTSVKGYLSMVLEGDAGKITPMQRKMLDQAFVSSQRMVFLIADLLNISRLKTGKFVIEPAKVNLAQVVADEVKQLHETAKGRSLELVYEKPADFPLLMLDDMKTRQVIMNFIDNAIHYTLAGGTIKVELIDKPSAVEFRVSDTGIGVPRAEQPHLFTKFYRAGNARRARPDGTGLGLFMAKKVVVAQGGAVLFDSKEGKGSTFGFIFSKTKLLAPVEPAHSA